MLHAVTKESSTLLPWAFTLGLFHSSISIGQVPKVLKEPLSQGVDNQQLQEKTAQGQRKSAAFSESQGQLCPCMPSAIPLP